jgi:hypothetical protein
MKKILLAASALACSAPGFSQATAPAAAKEADRPVPEPIVAVTRHSGTFGGQRMSYSATASETYLKAADGTPKASIFSIAYVKEPRDPKRPRHLPVQRRPRLGLLVAAHGRLRAEAGGDTVRRPRRRRAALPDPRQPDSLLDVTDIVFIDPVGTGFSRPLGKTEGKEYWGVAQDAKSVAEFIRIWLGGNGRWNSPKYLGGESYGRPLRRGRQPARGRLQRRLAERHHPHLDHPRFRRPGQCAGQRDAVRPLRAVDGRRRLPSRQGAFRRGHPGRVRSGGARVRGRRLCLALFKGQKLQGEERAAIRRRLARFTGLSERFLEAADLRVSDQRFYKELLRDRGLVVGRLDARYTGRDYDNAGRGAGQRPQLLRHRRGLYGRPEQLGPRRASSSAPIANIRPSAE